jgi:hypothetical protein
MDIDRLARRASEQLAARPSRRGIMGAATKLALGAGTIFAYLQRYEEAAGQPIGNTCCTGAAPCSENRCPKSTKERWSWPCSDSRGSYMCHDCNRGREKNVCVFATPR